MIAGVICAWLAPSQALPEALTRSAFETLGAADIVIAGEQHDNALHHVNQADIARAIYPSAIVFEMLTPDQAAAGQEADRAVMREMDDALGWTARGGWPAFHNYFPIFAAAPQARLYGAAVPRDVVRAAYEAGAASQFDDANYGLATPLEAAQQNAREALQDAAHCNALPDDALPRMVEAQRLRDASFAQTTLQALEDTGGPVLVITGNGHARVDWGMPFFIRKVAAEISVISVGQLETGEIAPPYDRWIMTGRFGPQGDDPCAAFSNN